MTGVIIIILIGLFLLLVEFLLIPGITVAGVGGVILIAGGITWAYTGFGTTAGHLTLLGTAIASVTVVVLALRSKTWKYFMLNTNVEGSVDGKIDENQIKVGDAGVSVSRLAPMGKARINGVLVEAKSMGEFIDQKKEVIVIKIEGSKVIVKLNDKTNE
ncbi:hypothetical protein DSECCO2_169900 [anaerobic digester metagenome]